MKKKERADKGQIRIKERDVFLLHWIADMYGIRLDHLRILAGRYSNSTIRKNNNILSESGAVRIVERWKKAGIVNSKHIISGFPKWVYLTKKGLSLTGADFPLWTASEGRQLKHKHAVSGVRLFLEEQRLKGQFMPFLRIPWISDRQINVERKVRGRRHIVDGELLVRGKQVAIEVELTAKSQPRLKSILEELIEDYSSIWYFVSIEARPAVETALERFAGNKNKFKIYSLPEYSDYHPENYL